MVRTARCVLKRYNEGLGKLKRRGFLNNAGWLICVYARTKCIVGAHRQFGSPFILVLPLARTVYWRSYLRGCRDGRQVRADYRVEYYLSYN